MNRTTQTRTLPAALVALTVVGTMALAHVSATSPLPQNGPPLRDGEGAVFAMTNATAGNEIVVYRRAADGTLARLNRNVPTRGLGIGVDTDTQGPLRLSPDNRYLYAVNPGSDNVTVFEVTGPAGQTAVEPCPAGRPQSPRPSPNFVPTADCLGWVPSDHPQAPGNSAGRMGGPTGSPAPAGGCPAGQPASARPGASFVPTDDCQGWVPSDHPLARGGTRSGGSDETSGTGLKFLQLIEAGDQPLSLTIHGDLLYVLNGSVAGNGIRGFRRAVDGTLTPLPNSFRELSSPIAVPGEVRFSPDGQVILVTQKTTNVLLTPENAIDGFTIGADGYASAMPIRNASFGLRPFALAFRGDNRLVVVEAFNAAPNRSAASSYMLSPDATISVISGSVPSGQTDICWVVITNDGRFAFTANFGSGTISSFGLSPAGTLSLINGAAASLGAMSQPVDLSLSADGRYLYQLLRGTGAVAAFRIEPNGTLTSLGVTAGGLPVADGASGLASY
jgi:6-phosphogluconolactonase (cycloisomerase 2 family)